MLTNGEIHLLMVYTKSKFDDLPSSVYKTLKEMIDEQK